MSDQRERNRRKLARQRKINAELRAAAAIAVEREKPFIQADGKRREPYTPEPRPAAIIGADLLLERLQAGLR